MKVPRDRKATKALLPDEFAAKRDFKKRNGLVGCKYLLETNRLILRQCTPDDLAIFEEIFGDGEMMRHFGECKPLSAAEARAWLDSCIRHCDLHGWGPGLLVRKSDGEIVGLGVLTYMLHDPDSEEGDLIYMIRKPFWGEGFATEFARVAIEYILDETPIKRVVATAMPENKASNRVLEKAGMRFSDYNIETNRNRFVAETGSFG